MVNTYRNVADTNSIFDWAETASYRDAAGNQRNPLATPGFQQTGRASPWSGNSGFGSTGLAGNEGWAGTQGYDRMQLQENVFENPEWLLPDIFPGLDTQGPGYAMLADLPFDPNLLYALAQYGSGSGVQGGGPDTFANFLNQMYTGIGGGQYIDFGEVLGMLTGAGADSDLMYWLDNADPGQVMGFLKSVLGTAAQGLDPFGQNVVYTMMPGMFAEQGNQLLKTNPQNTGDVNPLDAFQRGLATMGF